MKFIPREVTMLRMLTQGAEDKSIAAAVGTTPGSMRVFMHMLFHKLGVANRTQAAVWYTERTARERESAKVEKGDGKVSVISLSDDNVKVLLAGRPVRIYGNHIGIHDRVFYLVRAAQAKHRTVHQK